MFITFNMKPVVNIKINFVQQLLSSGFQHVWLPQYQWDTARQQPNTTHSQTVSYRKLGGLFSVCISRLSAKQCELLHFMVGWTKLGSGFKSLTVGWRVYVEVAAQAEWASSALVFALPGLRVSTPKVRKDNKPQAEVRDSCFRWWIWWKQVWYLMHRLTETSLWINSFILQSLLSSTSLCKLHTSASLSRSSRAWLGLHVCFGTTRVLSVDFWGRPPLELLIGGSVSCLVCWLSRQVSVSSAQYLSRLVVSYSECL